jgi:hypothetical protein
LQTELTPQDRASLARVARALDAEERDRAGTALAVLWSDLAAEVRWLDAGGQIAASGRA